LIEIAAKALMEFLVHLKTKEIAQGFENRMISFKEFTSGGKIRR